MNPHGHMLGPSDSMHPHFKPLHFGDPPPSHPPLYKMTTSHHSMNPHGMMISHPGDVSNSSINQGLKPMNHMNLTPQHKQSQVRCISFKVHFQILCFSSRI
jgi:hypothetical protein